MAMHMLISIDYWLDRHRTIGRQRRLGELERVPINRFNGIAAKQSDYVGRKYRDYR